MALASIFTLWGESDLVTLNALLAAVPAVTGYAARLAWGRSRRAVVTSLGTALGWVVFVGFFVVPLPVLREAFFVLMWGGPFALMLVAFAFVHVGQWSASTIVTKASGVPPTMEERIGWSPRGLRVAGFAFLAVGFGFFGWAAWAFAAICGQSGPCMSPLFLAISGLLAMAVGILAYALGVGRGRGLGD